MHYDLTLISQLCDELSLPYNAVSGKAISINLEPQAILEFKNYANEGDSSDDCLFGFLGADSHHHGDPNFYAHGHEIELSYLDLLTGLVDGTVLICELWKEQKLADRWLVHKDLIDEFACLDAGDEVRVRRMAEKLRPFD